SPRTAQFGGGSTGGLDDRFDFILESYNLADGQGLDLLPSTYQAYGQDGHHLNLAVNAAPTNAAVGQTIADALMNASDHLPVVVDAQVPAILQAAASLDFGTMLVGTAASRDLTVANLATAPGDAL